MLAWLHYSRFWLSIKASLLKSNSPCCRCSSWGNWVNWTFSTNTDPISQWHHWIHSQLISYRPASSAYCTNTDTIICWWPAPLQGRQMPSSIITHQTSHPGRSPFHVHQPGKISGQSKPAPPATWTLSLPCTVARWNSENKACVTHSQKKRYKSVNGAVPFLKGHFCTSFTPKEDILNGMY